MNRYTIKNPHKKKSVSDYYWRHRDDILKKRKEQYAALSDDQKKQLALKIYDDQKNKFNLATPEEQQAILQNRAKRDKKYRDSMSPEEKELYRDKKRERRLIRIQSMSSEEKEQFLARRREQARLRRMKKKQSTAYESYLSGISNQILAEQDDSYLLEDYPTSFDMNVFKQLRSYASRVQYCEERLTHVSSGSARIVYAIDDKKALKLAKNLKGRKQNEVEYDLANDGYRCSILANCYDCDTENFDWIEMDLAEKCTKKEFEQLTGIPFDTFTLLILSELDPLVDRRPSYIRSVTPEEKQYIKDNEFWDDLRDYVISFNIPTGDLRKLSSYGIVDGEIKIIDFGFNSDTKDLYSHKNQ